MGILTDRNLYKAKLMYLDGESISTVAETLKVSAYDVKSNLTFIGVIKKGTKICKECKKRFKTESHNKVFCNPCISLHESGRHKYSKEERLLSIAQKIADIQGVTYEKLI